MATFISAIVTTVSNGELQRVTFTIPGSFKQWSLAIFPRAKWLSPDVLTFDALGVRVGEFNQEKCIHAGDFTTINVTATRSITTTAPSPTLLQAAAKRDREEFEVV